MTRRRPGSDAALPRALAYAAHGWPVFPCRPGRKDPDTPHGFKDATTDPGRITAWWTAIPARNLAIATGTPGPDVLDVDVRPGGSGYHALRRLRQAGLLDVPAAAVATPGGGLHLYYLGTGQPSGRLPAQHLDFKATGGYVLTPPSTVGGRPYRLIRPQHERGDRPAAPRLDWSAAVALLGPPQASPRNAAPSGHADTGWLAAWVAQLPEGNRNAGLFWAACRAAETGPPQRSTPWPAPPAPPGCPNVKSPRPSPPPAAPPDTSHPTPPGPAATPDPGPATNPRR